MSWYNLKTNISGNNKQKKIIYTLIILAVWISILGVSLFTQFGASINGSPFDLVDTDLNYGIEEGDIFVFRMNESRSEDYYSNSSSYIDEYNRESNISYYALHNISYITPFTYLNESYANISLSESNNIQNFILNTNLTVIDIIDDDTFIIRESGDLLIDYWTNNYVNFTSGNLENVKLTIIDYDRIDSYQNISITVNISEFTGFITEGLSINDTFDIIPHDPYPNAPIFPTEYNITWMPYENVELTMTNMLVYILMIGTYYFPNDTLISDIITNNDAIFECLGGGYSQYLDVVYDSIEDIDKDLNSTTITYYSNHSLKYSYIQEISGRNDTLTRSYNETLTFNYYLNITENSTVSFSRSEIILNYLDYNYTEPLERVENNLTIIRDTNLIYPAQIIDDDDDVDDDDVDDDDVDDDDVDDDDLTPQPDNTVWYIIIYMSSSGVALGLLYFVWYKW